tara:strand:+ start:18 stop:584 length:567 start_codon:yes stop_codon:yes gene_type:complete
MGNGENMTNDEIVMQMINDNDELSQECYEQIINKDWLETVNPDNVTDVVTGILNNVDNEHCSSEPVPENVCSELEDEDQCNGEENCNWEGKECVESVPSSEDLCGEYSNEEECNNDPLSLCNWEGEGDEARCVEIDPITESFGNLFNMSNSSKDRNTMILIIIVILFFMYKDEIMKSDIVKSLKKMLK